MSVEMQKFALVSAVFNPTRIDNLKPDTFPFIGQRYLFEASWIIEEGPYAGQWAMWCKDDEDGEDKLRGWVPLCDLSDIGMIRAGLSELVLAVDGTAPSWVLCDGPYRLRGQSVIASGGPPEGAD